MSNRATLEICDHVFTNIEAVHFNGPTNVIVVCLVDKSMSDDVYTNVVKWLNSEGTLHVWKDNSTYVKTFKTRVNVITNTNVGNPCVLSFGMHIYEEVD